MSMFGHSEGAYQEKSAHSARKGTLGQSCQLVEPLWADPDEKSGVSVRELISKFKKRKEKKSGRETK